MTKLRNIHQTYQHREIVKTAPDAVVYIDGLPYISNPLVGGSSGTVINFNDHVTQISSTCDVESLIPSASVQLSVPIHLKKLYVSIGGTKIIKPMMAVQIYAKGYFLGSEGDVKYHRVFYGMIDHVAHEDTKNTLELTLSCKGILRFLEMIQTNQQPGVLAFNNPEVTPFLSKYNAQNPFEIIWAMLVDDIEVALQRYSVMNNETITTGKDDKTLKKEITNKFVKRWQPILSNLKGLTCLFGFDLDTHNKTKRDKSQDTNPASRQNKIFTDLINKWHPDFQVGGSIALVQSNIINRLEKLREQVSIIGYEAYQDIDGQIVIKPPLYNLDVTNTKIEDNPFVINLAEVISENEYEDEGAVRATRLSLRGNDSNTPLISFSNEISSIAAYTDIGLLSQFGIREESIKKVEYLTSRNPNTLFAFAAAELARINRGYRGYTVTIPFRPEIKLGFPIYVPHLDIYAYVRNISWNYSVGGACNMTLSCDSVRKRPLFKVKRNYKDEKGEDRSEWLLQAQPNLVHTYTKNGKVDLSVSVQREVKGSEVNTQSTPPETTVATPEEAAEIMSSETVNISVAAPGKDTFYSVMAEKDGFPINTGKKGEFRSCLAVSKDIRSKEPIVDKWYFLKVLHTQPYTDEKGFEVMSPFPWGRWLTLENALDSFKVSNIDVVNGRKSYVGLTITNATASAFNRNPLVAAQLLLALVAPSPSLFTRMAMKKNGTLDETVQRTDGENLQGFFPDKFGVTSVFGPSDLTFMVSASDPYLSSGKNAAASTSQSDLQQGGANIRANTPTNTPQPVNLTYGTTMVTVTKTIGSTS